MKYNLTSLDYALDELLPNINKGVIFNRCDLLRLVAEDYLTLSVLDEQYNPSFKQRMCLFVVAEAVRDLRTVGYFVPGDRILEEEV